MFGSGYPLESKGDSRITTGLEHILASFRLARLTVT